MYRRSRSNSCHHTAGRGRRSHSPDSGGRKLGKEGSKFSRKSDEIRSRSPRRNCWREETKNIRSWKEENERGGERTDRGSVERSNRDGGGTKISSRCYQKSWKKKPEESDPHSKVASPSSNKKIKDHRNHKARCESVWKKKEKFLLSGRSGSFSSDRRREKSISTSAATRGELGQVSNQVKRSGLGRNQIITSKENLEMSRRDSPDSDELVLRISEKDIFPELKDDWSDNKKVKVEAVAKKKSSDQKDDNKNKEDNENTSSSRKSKLVKDKLSPINISITKSLTSSDDSSNSSSSSTLLDEKDCNTAMDRMFSMVKLEMEVFTTRLKELEWERKQLRREREDLQGQEASIRRNISKEMKKKDKLTAEISQVENDNKENKENQG